MITKADLLALRAEWGLDAPVIEKDYVLGWLLAGIGNDPRLASWVFKGGTCLRKCYFETYRFSEDLDFTIDGGPISPEQLVPIFREIREWVLDQSGIELQIDEGAFRVRQNLRGRATTQGSIAFRGPLAQPTPAKIKLDLTSDELLVELMAEKMRALVQRCRPRDLYDVVHTYRHAGLLGRHTEVADTLARKCEFAAIAYPTIDAIREPGRLAELKQDWEAMLAHQLPQLPTVDAFLVQLDDVFAWLAGDLAVAVLPPAPLEQGETVVGARRSIVAWRETRPVELIRFAGANRLKIAIDYHPQRGRIGWRTVEPYSLRRSQSGVLSVFVLNDRGALRRYRIDRIRAVEVTRESFEPRFRIEF